MSEFFENPSMSDLRAGVARVDITPPVPIDCVGYVRRAAPATSVHAPLTATALVVEHGDGTRIAIVCFDLIGIGIEQGRRVRASIGEAIGCPASNVLLNYSHTHAGPQPFDDAPKLGGRLREFSEVERAYVESYQDLLVDVAKQATVDMQAVRVGAASGAAPGISVNRRERTEDGRTVLGWNPDGVLDTEVSVVSVNRLDGQPIAVLVGFPCHPVVLGGEHAMVGPDYPGVIRDVVERATGATCLFLMGAGGDVLPLEGFHDVEGPERNFGERVAFEALAALADAQPVETVTERVSYGSVTPISLYRRVPVAQQSPQVLGGLAVEVDFPLKPLPDLAEVARLHGEYREAVDTARAAGASQAEINPLDYHLVWSETAQERLRTGDVETSVGGVLQVLRLGPVAFAAIPGEPFNEIGLAIKSVSAAPYTFVCGYSNEYVGYFPTAAEYPFGGYEPSYSHHNSRRLEQVDDTCEARIVSTLSDLTAQLFPSQ